MKINLSLILKSLSLILIIIAFFIPVFYFRTRLNSSFIYIFINDLYTMNENDVSLFTFYYLFVACVILVGIMVEFFPNALGAFQKSLKSINLFILGSFLTINLFLLFEILYNGSFWDEGLFFISPSLYLMLFSAFLFFISFFFDFNSITKKVDNKNSVLPYEQLVKLKKLFDDQVLTKEEYINQKKILMEK